MNGYISSIVPCYERGKKSYPWAGKLVDPTDPGQAGYLAGGQAGPARDVSQPSVLRWECWSSAATAREHKSINRSWYSQTVFSLFDSKSCSSNFCILSLEGQYMADCVTQGQLRGTSTHTWLCEPGAWEQGRTSLHTGNCLGKLQKKFQIESMKAWSIARK